MELEDNVQRIKSNEFEGSSDFESDLRALLRRYSAAGSEAKSQYYGKILSQIAQDVSSSAQGRDSSGPMEPSLQIRLPGDVPLRIIVPESHKSIAIVQESDSKEPILRLEEVLSQPVSSQSSSEPSSQAPLKIQLMTIEFPNFAIPFVASFLPFEDVIRLSRCNKVAMSNAFSLKRVFHWRELELLRDRGTRRVALRLTQLRKIHVAIFDTEDSALFAQLIALNAAHLESLTIESYFTPAAGAVGGAPDTPRSDPWHNFWDILETKYPEQVALLRNVLSKFVILINFHESFPAHDAASAPSRFMLGFKAVHSLTIRGHKPGMTYLLQHALQDPASFPKLRKLTLIQDMTSIEGVPLAEATDISEVQDLVSWEDLMPLRQITPVKNHTLKKLRLFLPRVSSKIWRYFEVADPRAPLVLDAAELRLDCLPEGSVGLNTLFERIDMESRSTALARTSSCYSLLGFALANANVSLQDLQYWWGSFLALPNFSVDDSHTVVDLFVQIASLTPPEDELSTRTVQDFRQKVESLVLGGADVIRYFRVDQIRDKYFYMDYKLNLLHLLALFGHFELLKRVLTEQMFTIESQQRPVNLCTFASHRRVSIATERREKPGSTHRHFIFSKILGASLLHFAAAGSTLEDERVAFCEWILQQRDGYLKVHDADLGCVHSRDALGRTPLHVCALPKVARLLIQNGADVNACDIFVEHGEYSHGNSLQSACFHGNPSVAETILECARDLQVDMKNALGYTALYYALRRYSEMIHWDAQGVRGSAPLVPALLKAGANPAAACPENSPNKGLLQVWSENILSTLSFTPTRDFYPEDFDVIWNRVRSPADKEAALKVLIDWYQQSASTWRSMPFFKRLFFEILIPPTNDRN